MYACSIKKLNLGQRITRTCAICCSIPLLCFFLLETPTHAASIKLTDDTILSADVLQTDDVGVVVRLPRARIQTVDGQPLPPALVEGSAAPPFTVTDVAGQTQTVGPKSDHVTLLHFWVHWCPHCRSDAPKLQALTDQFQVTPTVRILTVNLDQERAKLDEFLKERHVTYPVIAAAEEAARPHGLDLPQLYQVHGFPLTYLIDAHGIIRQKIFGSFVESGVDVGEKLAQMVSAIPQVQVTPEQPHKQKRKNRRMP